MGIHVGLDMDDVVIDFVRGVCHSVYVETGDDSVLTAVTDWDLNLHLTDALGQPWWEWLEEHSWLWATFPAVNGAVGGMRQLQEHSMFVELLTKTPLWGQWAKWKWLGKWRPRADRVTFVPLEESKLDYTEAHVIVDDNFFHVMEANGAGLKAVLFKQPWSLGMDLPDGWQAVYDSVPVVDNWADLVDTLASIQAEAENGDE